MFDQAGAICLTGVKINLDRKVGFISEGFNAVIFFEGGGYHK